MKNTKLNRIRLSSRLAQATTGMAMAGALILSGNGALGAAFTSGNLVVERLGDGTETLGTTGNTIFFDEYNTTSTGQSPVQSIVIPDGNGHPGTPMIEAGTGGTTGNITLSPDGQTICFPGYAWNQGTTNVVTSSASTVVPRALGTLDGNGNYTRVATSTAAYSGSNIRGAATDGENNFWASGTASTTTVNAGVYYFGTAASAADVYSANLRGLRIFNGALWFSTASSTPGYGVWNFPGQPTTASTPTQIIALTVNDSCYGFAVNPAGTVIYEADDGGGSAALAGIHKYTGSGTNWVQQYILLNTGASGTGCFGLVADWTTTPPTLYATTAATTFFQQPD